MNKINIRKFIPVFFALFLTFTYIIKIRFGLHADEVLSIAIGDMIANNHHFISENWSTLQFTGLFLYPFVRIFQLFSSSNDGIILYFRYVFILIQIIVSLYTYFTIKRSFSKNKAILISLASFLFYYNWTTLNYKAFLYWFSWICILSIMNYLAEYKLRYILLSAVSLSACVLSYPGAIVLFIPCCLALFELDLTGRKKSIAAFCCTCITCAIITIIPIIANCGFSNFFNGIHQIVAADRYQEGLFHKLLRVSLPILVLIVIITCFLLLINRCLKHFNKSITMDTIITILGILVFTTLCMVRIQTITPSRVWYCLLLIFSTLPFFLHSEKMHNKITNMIQYLFLFPSLFMILAINISSNQGIAIASYGCIIGLYGILLLQRKNSPLTLLIMGFFLFTFLYFVPDHNPANSTLFTPREKICSGPAKGIYATVDVKEIHDEVCSITNTYVSSNDRLLILGTNNHNSLGYINSCAEYATYSPFDVSPCTEKLIDFYTMNPHLLPSVILIDKKEPTSFDEWSSSNVGTYLLTQTEYDYQESGNYIILQSRVVRKTASLSFLN